MVISVKSVRAIRNLPSGVRIEVLAQRHFMQYDSTMWALAEIPAIRGLRKCCKLFQLDPRADTDAWWRKQSGGFVLISQNGFSHRTRLLKTCRREMVSPPVQPKNLQNDCSCHHGPTHLPPVRYIYYIDVNYGWTRVMITIIVLGVVLGQLSTTLLGVENFKKCFRIHYNVISSRAN